MIFRNEFLKKIKYGEVSLAFRQWKKLSIKEGGNLKTSIGLIQYKKIRAVELKNISSTDAKKAGFEDLESLIRDLSGTGIIYRISFSVVGPDPRLKLRETKVLSISDKSIVLDKLRSLDSRGSVKNWVLSVLKFLKNKPGSPSKQMADELNIDQIKLKLNVRKLKNLGLTISLGTGYKLSPRGTVILKELLKSID